MLADAYQLTRHSYQSLAVMQQQMQRLTLGLSIAIFSIIAWVCWSVGGHLVAVLAQLREGTRRTASESPSYCASIRTPGEIGQAEPSLAQFASGPHGWHASQRAGAANSRLQPATANGAATRSLWAAGEEVLSPLRVSLPKTIDIHQHIDCAAGYVIADRTVMRSNRS
jgi:hypothetical protein